MTTTLDPALPADGQWQIVPNAVADDFSADNIAQGSGDDCYLEAAELSLTFTPDGRAYLLSRLVQNTANGKWGVRFTDGTTETIVEVLPEVAVNFENKPVKDTWPDIFETAYAQFRTGADTLASINFGSPIGFMFAIDLGFNPVQPRNVAELLQMAASGIPCFVQTPDVDGLRADMVRDHCYAVNLSGQLQNPWGASASMPQFITITDSDVLNYSLTMSASVAPPKAQTPPPLAPAVPQSPATISTTTPTAPIAGVTFTATSPVVGSNGNLGVDLYWNVPGAKQVELYSDNPAGIKRSVVSNPGSYREAEQWEGPQFYLVITAADGSQTTAPLNPWGDPVTPAPVTPALSPIAAEMAKLGAPLTSAWFAAQGL